MKVDIVIGASYGDEGKGLTTDYLISQSSVFSNSDRSCVVRFNGSCQAGHTVEYPNGRRVIYQHLGAGTARGYPTYLTSDFVVHPMLFRKEHSSVYLGPEVDRNFLAYPMVYAHPKCLVTTPWDMLINQCMERSRSTERHGSVGIGFGETIERSQHETLKVRVVDLWADHATLKKKLVTIRDEWLTKRFKNTKFTLNKEESSLYFSPAVLNNFLDDCLYFKDHVALQGVGFLAAFEHLVFEGAQGLMLDQDYGTFPYVTRSNTGIKNVMKSLSEIDYLVKNITIDVYYVSRVYTTRHGAGPLPFELKMPGLKPFSKVEDKTNITGEWQGPLRFGSINLDDLSHAIHHDINTYGDIRCNVHGVLTCLDQVGEDDQIFGILFDHVFNFETVDSLVGAFSSVYSFSSVFTSYGPTKETFTRLDRVL